ncbi:hypothetical protein BGZ82_005576, partial [Podila clonocystis]
MATTAGFGYPMVDTIRNTIAQIDKAILPYAMKRAFSVKNLAPNLLLYCQEQNSSATLLTLRKYRMTLQDQLVELVIASKDRTLLASHLKKVRDTVAEIESFYFSYHQKSPGAVNPPMDLVSCIYSTDAETTLSLHKR